MKKRLFKLRITGFTLIELLVVTAVMSILAVLSAQITVSILRSQNKTAVITNVRQNGDHVLNAIERDIKQAGSIDWASDIGITPVFHGIKLTTESATIYWVCQVDPNGVWFIGRRIDPGGIPGPIIPVTATDPETGVNAVSATGVPCGGGTNPFIIRPFPPIAPGSPWRVLVSFDLQSALDLPNISEFGASQHFKSTFSSRSK